MARFRFRLETVERVRKISEEQAMQELARRQNAFQQAIQAKEATIDARNNALIGREKLSEKVSKPADYQMMNQFLAGLSYQIVRADHVIVRARRFLNQAFRVYLNARKSRMMIDRLKERDLESFKKEQGRLAQKELDDLISMRSRLTGTNEFGGLGDQEGVNQ